MTEGPLTNQARREIEALLKAHDAEETGKSLLECKNVSQFKKKLATLAFAQAVLDDIEAWIETKTFRTLETVTYAGPEHQDIDYGQELEIAGPYGGIPVTTKTITVREKYARGFLSRKYFTLDRDYLRKNDAARFAVEEQVFEIGDRVEFTAKLPPATHLPKQTGTVIAVSDTNLMVQEDPELVQTRINRQRHQANRFGEEPKAEKIQKLRDDSKNRRYKRSLCKKLPPEAAAGAGGGGPAAAAPTGDAEYFRVLHEYEVARKHYGNFTVMPSGEREALKGKLLGINVVGAPHSYDRRRTIKSYVDLIEKEANAAAASVSGSEDDEPLEHRRSTLKRKRDATLAFADLALR